ncbi:protein lplB [Cohnella sp. CIP 111063]|uniref:ABC transporter permease n=1 Tax=unclassified Cohnella TaxID=2636738 RepID=UPI000B8C1069|nr:protein lplB [Cohnella sp. CIP 111063]PRX65778.1 carbohydrate ABC transporter membrane protein 1 (CUT1 family) [Cohnella sp. SGD-V74]
MKAMPDHQPAAQPLAAPGKGGALRRAFRNRYLYLMSLPFVAWAFVFTYLPLWGWLMAFQKYNPKLAVWERDWVGFDNFRMLFQDETFYLVMRNTLAMSVMSLIAGFTIPIVFALLLNEVKNMAFKKTAQTISYLPHFVSWAVVAGIVSKMLSTDNGAVNDFLMWTGLLNEPVQWLAKGEYFWGIVTLSDVWKETGWNAIIYLAAMAGVAPELYEAAKVDGASRLRQMWHITLPGIRPTIIILMILSIGNLINIGFEKQFLLGNNLVVDYSKVLDLYALEYGIKINRISFATAINMFNSVVAVLLLFTANGLFKRFTKESVF